MWLSVPTLTTTTYNRNVLLNFNELFGANCDLRYCKLKATHSNSDFTKPNSSANKFSKYKRNCLKEPSTMSTVQSVPNHVNTIEKADADADKQPTVQTNKTIDKIDNKLDNKSNSRLDDRNDEMKVVDNDESSKDDDNEKSDKENNKSEKLDKVDDKIESKVDANNNVCDKSISNDECADKPDLKVNKDEKLKTKDTSSVLSTTTSNNNNYTTKVATSYYVYSNGGSAMETNGNKRLANKSQDTSSNNVNSAQASYTHALNHPHLNATPYTIYTTGHYSINGQPTILSIPQNTALVNQTANLNQSIGQQMNSQHSHLHHNQYHHSNPNAHNNHHLHYHNIQQQQPYHSQSNYNQKNSIKNNSSLIKSSSSSVSTTSSSSNNSNNYCNNLTKSSSSSIINSTTYTSTYSTNNNNMNSPTSNQLQTKCNLNNNNLESIPTHHQQQQHYHSGYYNHYNGALDPKDTNSLTKTFRKIFVGGLPYHSTDKTLSKFFQTFGEIEEAVVIVDRQTGKSRGYGFVTMCDQESAERAVKEANPVIDGRKANVNLAYLGAKPRASIPPLNTGRNVEKVNGIYSTKN